MIKYDGLHLKIAVQRSHLSIDLFMKENKSGVVDMTVSPSVKVQIHSFYWVGKDQLCIITNKSIELLQLFPANQKTKVLAKHDISVRIY